MKEKLTEQNNDSLIYKINNINVKLKKKFFYYLISNSIILNIFINNYYFNVYYSIVIQFN